MKKIFIPVLALVILASCDSKKKEEMILESWNLRKPTIKRK